MKPSVALRIGSVGVEKSYGEFVDGDKMCAMACIYKGALGTPPTPKMDRRDIAHILAPIFPQLVEWNYLGQPEPNELWKDIEALSDSSEDTFDEIADWLERKGN